MKITAEQKLLYQAIDNILWHDWDPIGVNDIAPRDEYQSYTPSIFKLKINGATKEIIAQELHAIEVNTIGILGSIENCLRVAGKIYEL